MPLANCQQLNDSIFFQFSVTSRKKIIPAQHIDKKIYSFKGKIKEKEIHAAQKSPPPSTPITFLMVRPLAITFHQVILQSSFWQSKFKNKTKNSKNTFQSASLALGIRFNFCLLHLLTASLRKLEHSVMANDHNRIWGQTKCTIIWIRLKGRGIYINTINWNLIQIES